MDLSLFNKTGALPVRYPKKKGWMDDESPQMLGHFHFIEKNPNQHEMEVGLIKQHRDVARDRNPTYTVIRLR